MVISVFLLKNILNFNVQAREALASEALASEALESEALASEALAIKNITPHDCLHDWEVLLYYPLLVKSSDTLPF